MDEKTFGKIVAASGEKKTALVWKWQNERDEYGKKMKDYLWRELQLDTVICQSMINTPERGGELIADALPSSRRSCASLTRRFAWRY